MRTKDGTNVSLRQPIQPMVFFHTVTVRSGEYSNKDMKKRAVCAFRRKLLAAKECEYHRASLIEQIYHGASLKDEDEDKGGMKFGMFKAYVAAKVIGYANPNLFNVTAPPPEMLSNFSTMSTKEAQAHLHAYVQDHYEVYVGPHTALHLKKCFGFKPDAKLPARLMKALMIRHYLEVYPRVAPVMGCIGYSIHDDQHSCCEAEKIESVRLSLGKRRIMPVSCKVVNDANRSGHSRTRDRLVVQGVAKSRVDMNGWLFVVVLAAVVPSCIGPVAWWTLQSLN